MAYHGFRHNVPQHNQRSEMMAAAKPKGRGGKRPGAGRRPEGAGKKAWLSTRITQETRARLDAEAKRRGRSLSQVIEEKLDASLSKKEIGADPYLMALSFLMKELDRRNYYAAGSLKTDPYRFAIFRASVDHLLSRLAPPGPAEPPPSTPAVVAKLGPEAIGTVMIAEPLWIEMKRATLPPLDQLKHARPESVLLQRARHDLGESPEALRMAAWIVTKDGTEEQQS